MSLFELQEWLGHRMQCSTQRYAKITKLMKSYADAGYLSRNLRAIEVLIDQDKVRSGVAADEAWKFYDLDHGYCTYDFNVCTVWRARNALFICQRVRRWRLF